MSRRESKRRMYVIASGLLFACACSSAALNRSQREAELIGRVLEANQNYEYTLIRERRLNVDLNPDMDHIRYRFTNSWGDERSIDITCANPCVPDPRVDGCKKALPARCRVDGFPQADPRVPSIIAAELVAIVEPMQRSLYCPEGITFIKRHSAQDGGELTVRGCGQKRSFYVSCSTKDPEEAPRRCRIVEHSPAIEFDAARHPGIAFHTCPGEALGVLVPEGQRLTGEETIAWLKKSSEQLTATGVIRGLGFGFCCTAEDASQEVKGWCVRAQIEPGGDMDTAIAAVADLVLAAPKPRPRVLVEVYAEIGPLH